MTSTSRTSTARKALLGAAALSVIATGMWSATSPAAAAATQDQDDYPAVTTQLLNTIVYNGRGPAAQTFTAGTTGALSSVTLSLAKNGTGTGAGTTASIYTVSGGEPGCALATETVDPSTLGTYTSPGVIQIDSPSITFARPAQVQAGTQYAIVVSSTSGYPNSVWLSGDRTDIYAGGTALLKISGSWGPITNLFPTADFAFTTYVDSGLTGNSVCGALGGGSDVVDNTIWYQSYGRLSAAEECASGYTGSWAEWANGNTGGYVCNRAVYSYHPGDETTSVFFGAWRTS